MIGWSDLPREALRRPKVREERPEVAAAQAVLCSPDGGFGGGFASALADANAPARGGQATGLWERAIDLARAGGGSAKITLPLASGESVELRVSVRDGRVTVLAQVASQAAAAAIRAVQDQIARSLTESGLRLQQLLVRQRGGRGPTGEHVKLSLRRERRGEDEEESS